MKYKQVIANKSKIALSEVDLT